MYSSVNVRGLVRLGSLILVSGVVGCGSGGIEAGMPKDTSPPAIVPDVMKTGGEQKAMPGGGPGANPTQQQKAMPGGGGGPGFNPTQKK